MSPDGRVSEAKGRGLWTLGRGLEVGPDALPGNKVCVGAGRCSQAAARTAPGRLGPGVLRHQPPLGVLSALPSADPSDPHPFTLPPWRHSQRHRVV